MVVDRIPRPTQLLDRSALEAALKLIGERDLLQQAILGLKAHRVKTVLLDLRGPAPFRDMAVNLGDFTDLVDDLTQVLETKRDRLSDKLRELGVNPECEP